jgi:phosphoserine phosphatase
MTIFNSFSLRPAAVPLVGRLEANGFEICIITGSFDLYAEVVAAKLGVKNYYGNTTLYFDADDVVQSYDYYGDQSAKKVEQFKSFCEDRHITPNNCYAVGNGDGDIGLFSLTGHGILLRQDGQSTYLKDTARKTVDRLGQVTDTIEP